VPHAAVSRGFALVTVVIALSAGCSENRSFRGPKLESLAAEPELPAIKASKRKRVVKIVPNVTAPFKPFQVADHSTRSPAVVAAPDAAMPAMIATGAGGTVRLTSAEEPRHLESPAEATPIAEIREMLAGYLRAFNRHDALAAASHWAPTAENINLDSGELTAGREAVQAVFSALFDIDPTATIDIDVASIRPLQDDVAVIDGVSRVAYEDGDVVASRFSAVAVRHEGAWKLESVREAGATKLAAAPRPLDELAWLVGSWENVGPGVIASGRCTWWAGRSYLVRHHSITPDAARPEQPRATDAAIPALLPTGASSARELTEIIGWDPERQEIRSWLFGSDGRFAEATWHRDGDAWRVHVEGRGLDAGRTVTCTIERGGADALDIRCEGTGLEGLVPPSCGFTRTGS
jgi:uncharacterized protein (TIGR02246 family)